MLKGPFYNFRKNQSVIQHSQLFVLYGLQKFYNNDYISTCTDENCALKGQARSAISPGQAKRHPGFHNIIRITTPCKGKSLTKGQRPKISRECTRAMPSIHAFALSGRLEYRHLQDPGCRFACPGLCAACPFRALSLKIFIRTRRNYYVYGPARFCVGHFSKEVP